MYVFPLLFKQRNHKFTIRIILAHSDIADTKQDTNHKQDTNRTDVMLILRHRTISSSTMTLIYRHEMGV